VLAAGGQRQELKATACNARGHGSRCGVEIACCNLPPAPCGCI
jgi:hypothetical protein